MKAILPRSCDCCRSQLVVEDKKDVKEEDSDGRRLLSVVCPACGTQNEFLRKSMKEYKKITIDKYRAVI